MHKLGSFILGAALLCAGCGEIVNTHGHVLKDEQINSLSAGLDNKQNVLRTLGSPSAVTTFSDNRWYYYSATTVDEPLYPNQLQKRTVLIIDFNDSGIITAINKKSEKDAAQVQPNERVTKTHGQKMGLIDHLAKGIGVEQ